VIDAQGRISSLDGNSDAGRGLSSASLSSDDPGTAAGVTNFQHGVSVKVDPLTGGLSGLPSSWAAMLPEGCAPRLQPSANLPPELVPSEPKDKELKLVDHCIVGRPFNVKHWRPAFGVPFELCERMDINGFEIPCVLVVLWTALKQLGGLQEEGILRLAPDAAQCQALRADLNSGVTSLDRLPSDVHLIGNLIKIWFRDMPTKLLNTIPSEQILRCSTGRECMQLVQQFPHDVKGLLLWLLSVMAEVAQHQEKNKMNERAIAIVMAPNLYEPPQAQSSDPMEALIYSQKMTKFLCELLHHYVMAKTRVHNSSQGIAVGSSVDVSAGTSNDFSV